MPVQMKEDESEGEVSIILRRLSKTLQEMSLENSEKVSNLVNLMDMISLLIHLSWNNIITMRKSNSDFASL